MGKKSPFALTAPGSASQFQCCSTSLAYHQRQAFSCPPETLNRSPRMIALNSQTWVRPQSCLSQLKDTLQRYNLNALPMLETQSLATTHCKETSLLSLLRCSPLWSGWGVQDLHNTSHSPRKGVCIILTQSPDVYHASISIKARQSGSCVHVLWHVASVEEECDKVQWELCS